MGRRNAEHRFVHRRRSFMRKYRKGTMGDVRYQTQRRQARSLGPVYGFPYVQSKILEYLYVITTNHIVVSLLLVETEEARNVKGCRGFLFCNNFGKYKCNLVAG